MTPQISGKVLLIPRVKHWPQHGWRAEVVIDNLAMGDIIISEFVETREEVELRGEEAVAQAAASERASRREWLGLTLGHSAGSAAAQSQRLRHTASGPRHGH
jgi:hypothetical protein